jgi:hypothetical protein
VGVTETSQVEEIGVIASHARQCLLGVPVGLPTPPFSVDALFSMPYAIQSSTPRSRSFRIRLSRAPAAKG